MNVLLVVALFVIGCVKLFSGMCLFFSTLFNHGFLKLFAVDFDLAFPVGDKSF